MRARRVDASHGARWVLGGFRLLGRKPLALLALVVFDVFLLLVPSVLPLVGPLVPTLLTPVFGVGLMVAMRATDRGGTPAPQMLFAAFGEEGGHAWRSLLVLGAISAIATMCAVGLTALADGGALLGSMTGLDDEAATGAGGGQGAAAGTEGEGTPIVLPTISPALLLFLVLLLPIQAATWYAPLFIAWHGIPVGKAIFFSFVAVWRNRAAFVVYILSWIAAVFAVSTVASWAMLLSSVAMVRSMLLFFMSLAILTAMYGSVWLSYRDVIEAGAPGDPPGGRRPE
jgi:hypothetical protein